MVATAAALGIRENTRAQAQPGLAMRGTGRVRSTHRLLCQTYKAQATAKATAQEAA